MGRRFPVSFLRILPDYFCLLEFECQDLRRNTATMGCTIHFLPISLLYRAFVGRWDTGVVLGLVVYTVTHIARVWINRERLPILHVVS